MKLSLLFLLLPLFGISQKIVIGKARGDTKLYSGIVPRDLTHNPPSSFIKTKIEKGGIIASYARHSTDYGTWLLVFYNGTIGYVRLEEFDFNNVDQALTLSRDTNKVISYDTVIVRIKQYERDKFIKDSVWKKQREDESNAMKEANRKENEKALRDSILQARVAVHIVKQGFGVLNFEFPSDDYSVDFEMNIINYSKSTIKYVWVTIAAYNAVNDIIGTNTVKIVGPVPYGEAAAVNFVNIFFTRVFHSGKFTKIKVQYMDGKFREFTGKILNDIIME